MVEKQHKGAFSALRYSLGGVARQEGRGKLLIFHLSTNPTNAEHPRSVSPSTNSVQHTPQVYSGECFVRRNERRSVATARALRGAAEEAAARVGCFGRGGRGLLSVEAGAGRRATGQVHDGGCVEVVPGGRCRRERLVFSVVRGERGRKEGYSSVRVARGYNRWREQLFFFWLVFAGYEMRRPTFRGCNNSVGVRCGHDAGMFLLCEGVVQQSGALSVVVRSWSAACPGADGCARTWRGLYGPRADGWTGWGWFAQW